MTQTSHATSSTTCCRGTRRLWERGTDYVAYLFVLIRICLPHPKYRAAFSFWSRLLSESVTEHRGPEMFGLCGPNTAPLGQKRAWVALSGAGWATDAPKRPGAPETRGKIGPIRRSQ
jgi:hypothetical protein